MPSHNPGLWVRHPDFDEYWCRYGKLTWYFARHAARIFRVGDPDELLGTVMLAFNRAIHTYDPDKGKFSNYLGYFVRRWAMSAFLRYESECRAVGYFSRTTTDPDKKTLAVDDSPHMDLFSRLEEPGGGTGCPGDFDEDLWEYLTRNLTLRRRGVLACRFREGLSLKETGEKFDVTRERVRQIEREAIRRIQKQLRRDRFQYPGRLGQAPFHFKEHPESFGPYNQAAVAAGGRRPPGKERVMNRNVTMFVSNGRNALGVVRDTVRWAEEEGMRVRKIVLVCLPGEDPLVDMQAMAEEHRVILSVRKMVDDSVTFCESADDADGCGTLIVANGGTTKLGWGLSDLYHRLGDSRREGRREGDDARMLIAVDCQRDGCHVLASTWF